MAKYPKPFSYWTTYAGHGGVDYPQPSGTPILAVADGQITFSGWWNGNAGNTRTLTTRDGVQIMHCHLVNLRGPSVGKWVKAGEVIAYVGTTGHSTGNHLHHEIWVNGRKQFGANYWKYIDKNRTISASGGSVTPPKPSPAPQPKPKPKPIPTPRDVLEDDMAIIIAQRPNSALTKGRWIGGGKIQEITRHENTLFRQAEKQDPNSVIYATVPDETYNALLKGEK